MTRPKPGLTAWFARHPTVTQQTLGERAGGINNALISKYTLAEKWDGVSLPLPTHVPRDVNALRIEKATQEIDPDDFVPAKYWSALRLKRATAKLAGAPAGSKSKAKTRRAKKTVAPRVVQAPAAPTDAPAL